MRKRSALDGFVETIGEIFVEPRDVDAHRALIYAAGAAGAEFGEARVFELAGAGFPRAADAAGIGFAAEGVAADGLEIGAGIQAGAAADAVERFAQDGIVAHAHAAVVDQDEMEFARLHRLAGEQENRIGERRAEEAGVGGETLAGGAGGEEFDERRHLHARGNDFFDAGDGDVHRREEARHANVAFAFDEHEGAGVGGDQVRAGDADVGVEKFFAKFFAGEAGEGFAGIERKIGFEFALEERGDAFAAVVQRGADEVRRLLVGDLEDEFGEIGFDDFDAVGFEDVVELEFLRR